MKHFFVSILPISGLYLVLLLSCVLIMLNVNLDIFKVT